MVTIGILACSKAKAATPARAVDLYQGHVFRLARAHLERAGCERLIVLSALHGAVDGAEVIAPYERALADQPADVRNHWARIARSQLAVMVPTGARVLAIVPAVYAPALRDTPHERRFARLPIGRLKHELAVIDTCRMGDFYLVTADVTDYQQARVLVAEIVRRLGRLDILVNNAGIALDGLIVRMKAEEWDRTIGVNLSSVFYCSRAVTKVMMKHRYGRIVNISSTMGSFHEMDISSLSSSLTASAYRLSKAALNAATILQAKELSGYNILVNTVCPGWVRTDMGGPNAPLSVEQGAKTPVWLANLPDGGPTGKFFRSMKEIPW